MEVPGKSDRKELGGRCRSQGREEAGIPWQGEGGGHWGAVCGQGGKSMICLGLGGF